MPKTRISKLKIPFTAKRKYIYSNIQNNNKSYVGKFALTIQINHADTKKDMNNSNSTPMNKSKNVRISRKPFYQKTTKKIQNIKS
jgi:hypothetical protein